MCPHLVQIHMTPTFPNVINNQVCTNFSTVVVMRVLVEPLFSEHVMESALIFLFSITLYTAILLVGCGIGAMQGAVYVKVDTSL